MERISGKFVLCSHQNSRKLRSFDIRNFAEVGENSKDCAKLLLGHRKIEKANFRGSEISSQIRTKLTAISANFHKNEKQQ